MTTIEAPENREAKIAILRNPNLQWFGLGVPDQITTLEQVAGRDGYIFWAYYWGRGDYSSGYTRIEVLGVEADYFHVKTVNREPEDIGLRMHKDCIVLFYEVD